MKITFKLNTLYYTFISLLLFSLSACYTKDYSVKKDSKIQATDNHSYVAFSITQQGNFAKSAGLLSLPAEFLAEQIESGKKLSKQVSQGEFSSIFNRNSTDNIAWKTGVHFSGEVNGTIPAEPEATENYQDFTQYGSRFGQVGLLKVPAGTYHLKEWTARFAGVIFRPSAFKRKYFSIKPQEILYIGELALNFSIKEARSIFIFDEKFLSEVELTIVDQYDRDLTMLKKQYPKIDFSNMTRRIIK